jgi:hypothetical protein
MLTKYLLYQTDSLPFERALKAGVDINTIARLTPDTRSGVKNFSKRSRLQITLRCFCSTAHGEIEKH